jgi:hypothetical protein
MKMRIEAPNGNTLETELKNLRKYIAERLAGVIGGAMDAGMTRVAAHEHANRWAQGVLTGALENHAKACFLMIPAEEWPHVEYTQTVVTVVTS